jgi:hypothetical protein
MVLRWCLSGVTKVLRWCYSGGSVDVSTATRPSPGRVSVTSGAPTLLRCRHNNCGAEKGICVCVCLFVCVCECGFI